jgi:Tfp pilus assembly protein PilO
MKGKKIDLNEIKNSPYTIAVALVLVIVLVIAATAYIICGIVETKEEIVKVRASYEENLKEIAILEELRAQSEKAEAQLEVYKGILPDDLGDVFILQEKVVTTCRNFGLKVSSIEVTQVPAQTQETIFVFNVEGKFSDIHDYMSHISTLEQIHRFDAISLKKASGDNYTATISLAILSQNGAEGVLAAAVSS